MGDVASPAQARERRQGFLQSGISPLFASSQVVSSSLAEVTNADRAFCSLASAHCLRARKLEVHPLQKSPTPTGLFAVWHQPIVCELASWKFIPCRIRHETEVVF